MPVRGYRPKNETSGSADLVVVGRARDYDRLEPLPQLVRKSVSGEDDREPVNNTKIDPWRMICSLEIRSGHGRKMFGTGWFSGPHTVITVGHCIYNKLRLGGWAKSIRVLPARHDGHAPFGVFDAATFRCTKMWVRSGDPDYDLGCIQLPTNVGHRTGWFSVEALTDAELSDYMVNISGYPTDIYGGRRQLFHRNRIRGVLKRRVSYAVDTFGGQSGAPVWVYPTAGALPVVVALHAYGFGGTPVELGKKTNSGTRITPEFAERISLWSRMAADSMRS